MLAFSLSTLNHKLSTPPLGLVTLDLQPRYTGELGGVARDQSHFLLKRGRRNPQIIRPDQLTLRT